MKIGIYGQFYHKNSETHIQAILNALQSKGVEIVVEKNFLALMRENQSFHTDLSNLESFTKLDASYDLFFSIGGDGTILKSITFVRDLDIPIVGVNTTSTVSTVCAGSSVPLSHDYTVSSAGLTYSWQTSIDGGTTWVDVLGATAVTY